MLPHLRGGLAALVDTRADLDRREQALLAEAAALYDQMKITAHELAGVRRQQAITTEQAAKFQTAIHILERQRHGAQTHEHTDPRRPETLIIQPQE